MTGEELTMVPRLRACATKRMELSCTFMGVTAGSTSFFFRKIRSSVFNILSLRCLLNI